MNNIAHIQGLRALAVIAVFIFHLNPDLLKGGYLGVDVFFVISGFIITKILIQPSYQSLGSLKQFYKDRIVRLLPNYALMVLFTTILAYWVLRPYDLIQYAKTLQFSGLYVTNIVLAKQQGYFDISRELKPLLHTWSLSIEWQFYATFPFFILLIKRLIPKQLGAIILISLVASFLYKIYLLDTNSTIAFYSFPARIWQLLFGAYLAISPLFLRKPSSNAISYSLVIALVFCFFITDESSSYQIYWSALCCLAAGLLITSPSGTDFKYSLSHPIAIRIGDMSYAIYLWHWPMNILVKNFNLITNLYLEFAAITLLSIAAAWVSQELVEDAFRKSKKKISFSTSLALAFLSAIIFGLIGHYYYSQRGLEERFPHAVEIKANRLAYNWEKSTQTPLKILPKCQINEPISYFNQACSLGVEKNSYDFLILGDSHLEAISPALHATLYSMGAKGMIASLWGCPPLIGISNHQGHTDVCHQLNFKNQLDRLIKHYQPKNIILIGYWGMYLKGNHLNGRLLNPNNFVSTIGGKLSKNSSDSQASFFLALKETVIHITNKNIRLFILEDVPTLPKPIQDLQKNYTIPTSKHKDDQALIQNQLIALRKQGLIFETIDLSKGLCSESECFSYLNGNYLYWDHNHLTPAGASLTIPILKEGLVKYQR